MADGRASGGRRALRAVRQLHVRDGAEGGSAVVVGPRPRRQLKFSVLSAPHCTTSAGHQRYPTGDRSKEERPTEVGGGGWGLPG